MIEWLTRQTFIVYVKNTDTLKLQLNYESKVATKDIVTYVCKFFIKLVVRKSKKQSMNLILRYARFGILTFFMALDRTEASEIGKIIFSTSL